MDPHNKENRIKINKVCQEERAARVRHSELAAVWEAVRLGQPDMLPAKNIF
jgi:hypothetical protein